MNWDIILRIGAVVVASLAAIPGIYAIYKQLKMEKLEQRKLILEAESISADVAAKLIDSAGDLQEIYMELLRELKKQLEEQKVIICRLEIKIEEQNIKIEALCEQVRELGQEPRYIKEK
jgi:plasmid maintenance system antidote protein VapI